MAELQDCRREGLKFGNSAILQSCNPAMATFKITLAYDGTNYIGWQRQATGQSIQGEIEAALRELDGCDVVVTGAGRTDAGVHALGQVASFSLRRAIEPHALVRALNARLPADIRALSADAVAAGFHARYHPSTKTYRYRIVNTAVLGPFERHFAWHVVAALDVDAMDGAARALEGRHDFAAFASAGGTTRTTERTVLRSRVTRRSNFSTTLDADDTKEKTSSFSRVLSGGPLIAFEIVGDGFLRHMVRAIAGTLVEIGRGRRSIEQMRDALASRDRGRAGPTAPACGLFLVGVEYRDL
jgi:tRNA pseudouridine38-40 synthase